LPRAVGALLLALLALPLQAAADWEFRPRLAFFSQYDENPFTAEEAQEAFETGAWSASFVAHLPLTRSTRRSTTDLDYALWLTTYNQFRDLSGADQLLALGWDTSWSRRSSFSISNTLRWFMDQSRLGTEEAAEDSLVLIRRSRVTRNTLRVELSQEMSKHLNFETSLVGYQVKYKGIREVEDQIEGARTNYSGGSSYGGRVGVAWYHKENLFSEYFLAYERVVEDSRERITDEGEEIPIPGSKRDVYGVGASVTLPASRNGTLMVEAGVARVGADELRPESEDTTTTFGEVEWRKQFRKGSVLQTGYIHRIGSSFGTGGGGVIRAGYLSYDQPLGPRFRARVAANYTDRSGIEQTLEDTNRRTMRLNADLTRDIGRNFGFTVGVRWLRQDSPRLDQVVSYNVYRLGVRWYPRGWN